MRFSMSVTYVSYVRQQIAVIISSAAYLVWAYSVSNIPEQILVPGIVMMANKLIQIMILKHYYNADTIKTDLSSINLFPVYSLQYDVCFY